MASLTPEVLSQRVDADIRSTYTRHGQERWIKQKTVGQGACGKVWSEVHETTGAVRAIKRVPKAFGGVPFNYGRELQSAFQFSGPEVSPR
jgi:hypothetical protein